MIIFDRTTIYWVQGRVCCTCNIFPYSLVFQVHKTSILPSTAKEYNHSGPKSTDSMIIVVGVVVGVLGTVAIALIVAVIIISQRGKSTQERKRLSSFLMILRSRS